MTTVLSHRGPDGAGLHVEAGVGFGHRRLAIIDRATGQQPLFNEDGSVCVVFNGEIYQFRELTAELEDLGHQFRTKSDTEVIVHAWEEWGERCVDRFRGMFAFAVWDRNLSTLFLARDRLGIKPLYYSLLPDGMLLFGSELKAVLAHPDTPRRVDPSAVEDYLAYGYVPDPRSIFAGIAKLPPGHVLRLQRGKPVEEPRQYWNVSFAPTFAASEEEAASELLDRIREAVRIRLIAEVPLGAFLSGGIDSSTVVALMAQLSSAPVVTSSISFGDSAFDESTWAECVAQRFRTDHTTHRVNVDDFELIDQLAGLYDEPFADSSAMPTYRVSQVARQRVVVALSGDGGDEILAGYRRYHWHLREEQLRGLVPARVRQPLFTWLGNRYPDASDWPRALRAKGTLEMLGRDGVSGYFGIVALLPDSLRRRVLSRAAQKDLQGYEAIEVLRGHLRQTEFHSALAMAQYLDLKTYLPGDILTKVDRASMAHGLEVRVPLLDHPLVEWTAGLPDRFKMKNGDGKHVLKMASATYLPSEILRRPKMGFAVPIAKWFRGPLRERVGSAIEGELLNDSGLFDRSALREIARVHMTGRRDHSAALWALLMFDAFLRQTMRSGSGDSAAAVPLQPADVAAPSRIA